MEDRLAVSIGNQIVYIRKSVFEKLFQNSHIYDKKECQNALRECRIRMKVLQKIAREARIPYSLFFAPPKLVDKQIERNINNLFKSVDSGMLSMSGRGRVDINDINLIIKDITQKQFILCSKYKGEEENKIVGCLQKSYESIEHQAQIISNSIGFDIEVFCNFSTKEKAYNYLVSLIEAQKIFISRSRIGFMPQSISRKVSFSGVAVKNKKFPYIFLYSKDESMVEDPTGRRILTLLLLLICIAKNKFAPITYSTVSKDGINVEEYEIAEEILLPRGRYQGLVIDSKEQIIEISQLSKLSPSATLMRLNKISAISEDKFNEIYNSIKDDYVKAKKESRHPWSASDTTKVKTYSSIEFTNRLFRLNDHGKVSLGDMRRVLLFNKKSKSFLDDLRAGL